MYGAVHGAWVHVWSCTTNHNKHSFVWTRIVYRVSARDVLLELHYVRRQASKKDFNNTTKHLIFIENATAPHQSSRQHESYIHCWQCAENWVALCTFWCQLSAACGGRNKCAMHSVVLRLLKSCLHYCLERFWYLQRTSIFREVPHLTNIRSLLRLIRQHQPPSTKAIWHWRTPTNVFRLNTRFGVPRNRCRCG